MEFIRFFNKSPSPFDDPNHKDFESLIRSYFEPRPHENGKSSFFLKAEGLLEKLVAGFIAIKKDPPENQRFVSIHKTVFLNSKVPIEVESMDSLFSCISSLHYNADFSSTEVMDKFVAELRQNLMGKSNKDYRVHYNKSAYRSLLSEVYKVCDSYEKELCSDWILDFIEELKKNEDKEPEIT
ncbi:hypothetical protein EHQ13_16515 [Leptospira gomenensis]|uniref:Uncharacterized protein n=1 Tax=Leptospira gomenensis TaxID=2484974 RepID=A0A5F1YIW8_9LEPT|nr:hypothetical protein [Leptospira gomenensis]TGK27537.1 hypothetical protein EHQ17_19395 [Leptospira gomenensis]TGK42618.1 hypothetical protein EHQ07_14495 [Leptospira gomenensis]TGK55866.1 hypothetical protein EHQ13_16515 [Leptospira gomenensis]